MSALTTHRQRIHSVHQPQFLPIPVKAGARLFLNAIVCTGTDGLAVPGSDTADLRAHGVAWKPFDNTLGGDGTLGDAFNSFGATRYVEVDGRGEWELTVQGAVPHTGDDAFVVDDDTVATATANSILLGRFTRPATPGKWFVDLDRR